VIRAARYLGLVKFSHSVFALPFALMSAWLAAGGVPPPAKLALIAGACVAARTSAMAFNRWLDRELDAQNPRTAGRELPRGVVSPGGALALAAVAAAFFVGLAAALSRWCGLLAPPVLGVLLGYSFAKRFTWLSHVWLGLALALAPLGAWLAVRGDAPDAPDALGGGAAGLASPPLLLAAAVLCWVAGFDLIYAAQDAEHDRRAGLHSIPARFGIARALTLSAALHAATLVFLALLGWSTALGWPYWSAFAAAAALLAWQHTLVGPGDLSRVDLAFFTLNGWVGVVLFAGLAVDLALGGGGALS
jgi:4-hydroxybenzoate polyprenyltransferase